MGANLTGCQCSGCPAAENKGGVEYCKDSLTAESKSSGQENYSAATDLHTCKAQSVFAQDAASMTSTAEGSRIETESDLASSFVSFNRKHQGLATVSPGLRPEAPRSQIYPTDGEWSWEFSAGNVFSGQWRSQKMWGEGQMTWPNGQTYVGTFRANKKHGFGKFSWPDGRSYEGQWEGGKQHGKGTYTDSEGREWTGFWEHGKKAAENHEPVA